MQMASGRFKLEMENRHEHKILSQKIWHLVLHRFQSRLSPRNESRSLTVCDVLFSICWTRSKFISQSFTEKPTSGCVMTSVAGNDAPFDCPVGVGVVKRCSEFSNDAACTYIAATSVCVRVGFAVTSSAPWRARAMSWTVFAGKSDNSVLSTMSEPNSWRKTEQDCHQNA